MTNQPSARPVLLTAEPQIFVADMAASCVFYTHTLGFAVAFLYGQPPYYGQVVRDAARLNLRCVVPPVIDPTRQEKQELLSATIGVDDVEALYRDYLAAGVALAQPIATQPWGARSFIVRDPDGNLILFFG